MALTNTLADLRTLARQRADMVGSSFITDAELTGYANSSLAELHDMLVTMLEEYFTKTGTLTVGSTGIVALPADCYKIRLISWQSGGDYIPLKPITVTEKWRYQSPRAFGREAERVYLLMGPNVTIFPTASAPGTYEIVYASQFAQLSSDSDVPFVDSGVPDQFWDEYVVVDMAIKCLQKEESDVSILMAQKAALRQRIVNAAASRDISEPAHVLDVDSDTPAWPWWSR